MRREYTKERLIKSNKNAVEQLIDGLAHTDVDDKDKQAKANNIIKNKRVIYENIMYLMNQIYSSVKSHFRDENNPHKKWFDDKVDELIDSAESAMDFLLDALGESVNWKDLNPTNQKNQVESKRSANETIQYLRESIQRLESMRDNKENRSNDDYFSNKKFSGGWVEKKHLEFDF